MKPPCFNSIFCSAEAIHRSWPICYCMEISNRTHTHTNTVTLWRMRWGLTRYVHIYQCATAYGMCPMVHYSAGIASGQPTVCIAVNMPLVACNEMYSWSVVVTCSICSGLPILLQPLVLHSWNTEKACVDWILVCVCVCVCVCVVMGGGRGRM